MVKYILIQSLDLVFVKLLKNREFVQAKAETNYTNDKFLFSNVQIMICRDFMITKRIFCLMQNTQRMAIKYVFQ